MESGKFACFGGMLGLLGCGSSLDLVEYLGCGVGGIRLFWRNACVVVSGSSLDLAECLGCGVVALRLT